MNVVPDYELWTKVKKEFEGCRLEAYLDSGKVWTIGFGTTFLFDKKRKVQKGDKITLTQAAMYLEVDSKEVVRQANTYVHKQLNTTQSVAICDYIYNRGIGNFLKAEWNGYGLDELINESPLNPVIPQIIRGTGLRDKLGNFLRGLQRRRNCEALLYEKGILSFA